MTILSIFYPLFVGAGARVRAYANKFTLVCYKNTCNSYHAQHRRTSDTQQPYGSCVPRYACYAPLHSAKSNDLYRLI